ncbi:MAG: sulfatase-like hydrolase/transferase [Phycisphaerae bacterium]|nr:sulfatase-like hydrolase/transferase [Phycisphaerae bacterium]
MANRNASDRPPNVILVLTDDQGYGDLGCLGNPAICTPNIGRLYGQSLRLPDFHVGPTCSSTRASLMTGRYRNRTSVRHTVRGRSLLRRDEVTMADVSAEANEVTFRTRGKPGKTKLQTWLTAEDRVSRGAYFVYVRRIPTHASGAARPIVPVLGRESDFRRNFAV